jgi:hypothetical protein
VGLIGPPKAGKTTFFAVLDRALRDLDWNVEIHGDGDDSSRQTHESIRYAVNSGYYPDKTPDFKSESARLFFRISKGDESLELSFYDPAGELFMPTPAPKPNYAVAREKLFQHLKECTGILVLLDLSKSAQQLQDSWRLSIESFLGFIRQNQLESQLLDRNLLKVRTAVVFAKADLLPWFARHRQRDASAWLRQAEGLRELNRDIRNQCQEDHVRFFFCSAVGWNQGRPNSRTVIVPRPVSVESNLDSKKVLERDLIPDPAAYGDGKAAVVAKTILPLFTDPLQLVNLDSTINRDMLGGPQLHGVRDMPGCKPPSSDHDKFLTPWNIVEPLLWAARGQSH